MILERTAGALGYDVSGEGPAVLLLPPFPFDRRFWASTKLPGFRVVSVDMRGFGESATSGDFSLDDLADDVLAVLDHLGIPMVAAVGASMGGYVALSLAARHPQRLSALVLVGSRAGGDGETAHANRDAAARAIRDQGPQAFLEGQAVRLCGRSSSDTTRRKVQQLIESSSPDFACALPAMLLALRDRPDRTASLSTLHIPTLVLVGDEDAVTPPDEARMMKRAIPGAAIVELAHTGHLPSIESAQDFERSLLAFLESTLAAQ